MNKHPVIYLMFGIFILVVPTIIYLFILIPQLKEEYSILMASGGVIGGFGLYGSSKIPEKFKYSSLFKLASNSFTIITVIFLVEKFIVKLLGLAITFIVSFIIYKIFLEVYKNAKRRKQNTELAEQIARSIAKNT